MNKAISKITYSSDITLVTLASLPCDSGVVADVLSAFAESGVNVDMISQTAPQGGAIRLSFTVSDAALTDVLSILGRARSQHPDVTPEILPGNCKLAFYDPDMVHTPGVAANVFTLLSQTGIQVMLVTTSDVDISLLVSSSDLSDALSALSGAFSLKPEEVSF